MTGRAKIIEIIKSIIIVILIVTAIMLSYSVWFYGERGVLSGIFSPRQEPAKIYEMYEESAYTLSVISPLRLSIRNDLGLYHSSSFDASSRANSRTIFESLSPILGEALANGSAPVQVTNTDWDKAISGRMVLLDFEGDIPLWCVCAALNVTPATDVDFSARYIIMYINDRSTVDILYKSDAGHIYKSNSNTGATYLSSIMADYLPNGSYFPAEIPSTSAAPAEFAALFDMPSFYSLTPYNFLEELSSLDAGKATDNILLSFGFNPYTAKSYTESDGIKVYVEDFNTLRIYPDGYLTYYSPEADELPGVDISDGKKVSLLGEAGRICQSIPAYSGGVSVYVLRAYFNDDTGRFVILLGSEYNTIPILNEKGSCAKFEYKNAKLVSAELSLISLRASKTNTQILPVTQAIAASSNGEKLDELGLYYSSDGVVRWLYSR
ncbi:MAG: hypothetical protein GX633_01330 [Clostridiales bacterium]|nr:hypothetical protein [Clostridiales bacterium]